MLNDCQKIIFFTKRRKITNIVDFLSLLIQQILLLLLQSTKQNHAFRCFSNHLHEICGVQLQSVVTLLAFLWSSIHSSPSQTLTDDSYDSCSQFVLQFLNVIDEKRPSRKCSLSATVYSDNTVQ